MRGRHQVVDGVGLARRIRLRRGLGRAVGRGRGLSVRRRLAHTIRPSVKAAPASTCTCAWKIVWPASRPVLTIIRYASADALLLGHACREPEDVGEVPVGGCRQRGDGGLVTARHDEDVDGRRRVDVAEGERPLALGHAVGRDVPVEDLADEAVTGGPRGHDCTLGMSTCTCTCASGVRENVGYAGRPAQRPRGLGGRGPCRARACRARAQAGRRRHRAADRPRRRHHRALPRPLAPARAPGVAAAARPAGRRGRRAGRLRRHAPQLGARSATAAASSATSRPPSSTGAAPCSGTPSSSTARTSATRPPPTPRARQPRQRRDARPRTRPTATPSWTPCAPCPPRQREVLVLRYYSDLSEAQIAHALEISPGAVKTHAHRGLTALRRTIDPLELS